MGGHRDATDPPPCSRPVWIVRAGQAPSIERPAVVVLEDGSQLAPQQALPHDLPLGYHDLHPSDGGPTTRLIVVPDRCHLPPDLQTWCWTVQLYAARSRSSWGIGDLGDLRRLAAWSRSLGAGLVAINPLHAPAPSFRPEPSPYFPSSRRFRNPLYLRVEDVPGFDATDELLARAVAGGRALNADRLVHRTSVWQLKLAALEALWSKFTSAGDVAAFDRYCEVGGTALRDFARFGALAEHHGGGWTSWPREHSRPGNPSVERFAAVHADRVRFHQWLQWLLDEQLAAAARELPLLCDLAVGFDPSGADGWVWQDVLARGMRVGAPPDDFNTLGQDWGLPPFVPWKLRAAGYEPLAETIRAAMRHAGGLRVDHVMGLFRLFWVPEGDGPAQGAYVRYPASELLDIVALESVRAGAIVVGEDLGTVEPEVRDELSARGVLSYRLLWFEEEPPEQFPRQALSAVTTHDLPTVTGVWTGSDLAEQQRIGLEPKGDAAGALRTKLARLAGVEADALPEAVVDGAYLRLARAPSMIVSAALDDALGVEERPNVPGTTDERPNWSIALPEPLEELETDERVLRVAQALDERTCSTH